MESTQKSFLWAMKWALLFIIMLIVSVFCVYHLFSGIWGNDILSYFTNMPEDTNKITAMSDAGSAIIGYSLAFAGAFTTIILAFLGARLAFLGHKLALGERVEYLNDKYENVVREYSNAIAALMHAKIVYNTLICTEPWEIEPETGRKIQLKEDATLTENLRASHASLVTRLLEFVAAMEQLGMNPLAQAMFRRLMKPNQSAILKAQDQFYAFFPFAPRVPFATTFFEWSALIRNRLYCLQTMDPLKLAQERNTYLSCLNDENNQENFCADDEGSDPPCDHEDDSFSGEEKCNGIVNEYEKCIEKVCDEARQHTPRHEQDILGLGYYLDFHTYNKDSCNIVDRPFAHSGAAFICDLAQMYPNNEALKVIFKESFPSHKDCENEMGFAFSLENAFPVGFMESVRGMKTFAGEYIHSKQDTDK